MPEWKSGQIILGEYTIEKELGRGGMGRVWLVKSQSTGRRFAVKQTLLKEDKHRKAFLAELQTWIDLPEHPNIVPCRFFRTVGDEIVIFADYIEGGSLADWIAKGKLTGLEQILDVAIQFAWGLHAIHERGLIHQDVKPGNVLMTPEGVPMVTDFGLARARLRASDGGFVSPALPPGPGQQSVMVSSGGMTPAYASPEQRNGKPLSRKTDIWSWGVSILDMFMGGVSCPHGGQIAAEVLDGIIELSGSDLQPPIPEDLVCILRHCFAASPRDRHATLLAAAESCQQVYCTLTRSDYKRPPPAPAERHDREQRPFDRRIRNVEYIDPRNWLRRAYEHLGRNPDEVDRAYPVSSFDSPKAMGLSDLAVFHAARALYESSRSQGDPAIYQELATLCMHEALVHERLGDAPGARECIQSAIAYIERVTAGNDKHCMMPFLAGAYANFGVLLRQAGETEASFAAHDKAIQLYSRLVDTRAFRDENIEESLATTCMNHAVALSHSQCFAKAAATYDRAIGIYERLLSDSTRADIREMLSAAFMNKALALSNAGKPEEALPVFDRAITIRLQSDELHRPDGALATLYMNKAMVLARLGRVSESAALYDQAIAEHQDIAENEACRDGLGSLALLFLNKGVALADSGQVSDAIVLYEKSIGIYERLVVLEGHTELASSLALVYMNKGNALRQTGDVSGALQHFSKSLAIYRHLVDGQGQGQYAADYAMACMNAGITERKAGNLEQSTHLNNVAVGLLEGLVMQSGRDDLAALYGRALLLRADLEMHSGNEEQAREYASDTILWLLTQNKKTGRPELKQLAQWGVQNFGHLLRSR